MHVQLKKKVKRLSGYLGQAMGQQDVWFCAICKGWLEMSDIEISVAVQGGSCLV